MDSLFGVFEIVESIEAQGLANHNDEDPCIVRVVAKKIDNRKL